MGLASETRLLICLIGKTCDFTALPTLPAVARGPHGVFSDSPSEPLPDRFIRMEGTTDRLVASRKPRSKLLRGIYFILGLICLGFVYVSFLPGIPTFDFVILAAFFFSMSSDKFYSWMMNHKVFGRIISGYREGGLTMRMKWLAAIAIVASLSFSAFVLIDSQILRVVLLLVGVYALWFVFTRRTKAKTAPDQPPLTA